VGTILGNFSLIERQSDAADVILDAAVDVFDLVGIINLIYGYPVDQQNTPSSGGEGELFATVNMEYGDLFSGDRDELVVHSDLPADVAGVEMDLTYDPFSVLLGAPTKTADADGLQLTYRNNGSGRMKILMNFTNPKNQEQLIKKGLADLVKIPMMALKDVEYGNNKQIYLSSVKLSTATAKSIRVDPSPILPTTFALSQNYPNPFNPTTTIEFSIAGGGEHVTLDVFNVLGQQVRNLVDQPLGEGHYTVEWDATTDNGRKVATGVYLYRLQVGPRAETKKMLLLK
jgi:hypothetical protein